MKFNKNRLSLEAFTSIRPYFRKLGIPFNSSFFNKRSVQFLNIAQFLGVINDNVFKLVITFLFIDIYGVENSAPILFWVGTIYVLPFLLFSSIAGVFADYFSKQKIIALFKLLEAVIMIFGIIAFWYKSSFSLYLLLFFLSFQSAILGPPKYSIIPELVSRDAISKANATITSWTYLGMIVGTFLASVLTQLTNRNFMLIGCFCLTIALIGYVASLCLPKTTPAKGQKKVNPFFVYEIYKTLKSCQKIPHLLLAICATAFFLYIGAFFQLNVIPFAIESLGLTEVGGGYLFLTTAIGIACGAYSSGKLGKRKIELGLPAMALLFISCLTFFLSAFAHSLIIVLATLITIGFLGGLLVVPLDSYIQTFAPEKKRGQVIAASNFISFIGVLAAPITIRVLNGGLSLNASTSFVAMGLLSLAFSLLFISTIPQHFFNYFCRTIINPIAGVTVHNFPLIPGNPVILMDRAYHWKHLLYIVSHNENILLCVPSRRAKWYHMIIKRFTSLRFVYYGKNKRSSLDSFLYQTRKIENKIPCILVNFPVSQKQMHQLRKKYNFSLEYMAIQTLSRKDRSGRFKRAQVTVTITG